MGSVEFLEGNPQGALEPLSKGLSLAVQLDNAEQKALILQALGISYRQLDKTDEAIRNIQDSMEITRRLGMKRLLANSLSELAQDQITLGKADAATESYNQALQILREIGVKKDYGDILINRGVLYQTRGDYDKALQDYKEALQIQRDAGDLNFQALCLSNIGDVYFSKFDTDNALTYYQQSLQLRQKMNEPVYLAETLASLGEVYASIGDYDQALANLMNGLEVARKANDARDAATLSGLIGKVLMYQGRLGSAESAMQDSVNGFRSTKNQSLELADALNNLAETLALVGRGAESGNALDEATSLASGLKNETVRSQLLSTRGDAAYYMGNWKLARAAYEQAMAAAGKSKDKQNILISRTNLARVASADGRAQAAIGELQGAIQQADTLHLKYYWLRSRVDLAEATIKIKDFAHARQELDSALSVSEKLALRVETARIHCLLGDDLRLAGNSDEASRQYQLGKNLLEDLKKDAGAEHVLERSDLGALYVNADRNGLAKSR
jgi:tetratricopeptide (TPR) repeat protein